MTFIPVPDKGVGDNFTEEMWDKFVRDNLNKGVTRPIAHSTLSSSAASFDFTSIAADFSHLFLVCYLRADQLVQAANTLLRFNNDSANNYDTQFIQGVGTTPSANEAFAGSSTIIASVAGANAASNRFGGVMCMIPHYTNTTHQKSTVSLAGVFRGTATGDGIVIARFGQWRSNSAINRITILPGAGNWIAESTVTLYGMGAL